ncbi:Toluene efflux pump periplasmic linker protein TtgD precursor [Rhodobacteraceae bacterium THAF1]|uniref:efflux RND transporter periplasmic adaptor subunit n=1 Tax=Palleronia sp. THAF1 TaxID=2587842 RepID=UPI000F3C87C8|nr:efflux RND transporter periplasmic adaptor subunit [Palleronia sp. THAF1]QFU08155.1 Toluene efflux pump periplasmic linker protein TtgD precursor [Palleronia sp. THAF1]VDC28706.1 Toluene efflux pump periplasmic linker protein TtgD precursor [Rhodobacteraceae bacterium THAF1]
MTENSETLDFKADKGASRATWIASALVIAIVGWMGSGYILPSEEAQQAPTDDARVTPVAVSVMESAVEPVTLFFRAEGQAQPDRDTQVRAEASGDVAEVLVSKGEDVADGDVIARLSTTSAEANLTRAREDRTRAQREFDNASELLDRGVATVDRVAEARAALAAAQAALTTAEDSRDSLEIVAPFAGRIETLTLDPGEFVQAGAEVGRIVDNRPLTVAIQVPQQALNRIQNGQDATVTFITGEERQGTVSFVGTSANSETRTFLAEITVANEDGAIPAGISAEINIPTGQAQAHFVQPSTVSLSPEGRLGVKTVDTEDRVVFNPIEIVRAEIDGIWVTGLPDAAQIITVGQGFVNTGETVDPSPADNSVLAEAGQ